MNSHDLDERIRAALRARADQVSDADLSPAPMPSADPAGPRLTPFASPWRRRWLPPLLAAAAVVAVAAGTIGIVTVVRDDRAHPANTPAPSLSSRPTLSSPPTVEPPPTSAPVVPPTASAPTPPAFELGYQPLYPFATLADANAWQASYRSGGHQPWHLDAGQTAQSFVAWLGFAEINVVTSTRTDSIGAHVGVGFRDLNGTRHTAAVLHLVRFGADADSPWEVVGSDDTTFSLETPAYGSVVTSPITVGGHITAPEPLLHVWVRQLSSTNPLGERCCIQAVAGPNMPWSAKVSFAGATDPVVTVVATYGGGLQSVELFAIQGLRVR